MDPVAFWFADLEVSGSGEDFMKIVGCDFHPGWQQVVIFSAAVDAKP
jgi:hypothetical protein